MSEEQFKAFQESIQADASLQEKLNAAADADAVVAIAKTAGFVISVEELQAAAQAVVSAQAGELQMKS
jgi:predicted ribosomally synthesized peptide with nif11-like leader